ncbi:MAG TPA: DUF4956 domain-containing protein [Blastocatellia bacterium]|nr:DUF4956 domain-containing protein [Blastocatellia bacterium]
MQSDVSKPSNRQVNLQIWKLAAYFSGLVLFSYVTRLVFTQFDLESWAGFKKFTDLINETANVTAKRDDLIVTAYSLLVTLLGVIPVCWVYTFTKEEEGYDQSLVQTLIVLALTVCGVMMMLQDSLARAFGFLGVVGAVRYRNTLKDPKDAVYVFVALGIGMGCGLRVYHVAALLSVVLCVVFLVMWKLGTGQAGAINLRLEKPAKEKTKEKKNKGERDLDALLALLSDETRHAVKKELQKKRADAAEVRQPSNPSL